MAQQTWAACKEDRPSCPEQPGGEPRALPSIIRRPSPAPGAGIDSILPAAQGPELQKRLEVSGLLNQIKLEHRMKRKKKPNFGTNAERVEWSARRELDALVEILPKPIGKHVLGGDAGLAQVPSKERQDAQIARRMAHKAGKEGAKPARLRNLLSIARQYALTELGLEDREQQDAAMWPMTQALANELIFMEQARAEADGHGTVGARLRDTMIHAHDNCGWPIEVPRESLASAAPKAAARAKKKAGTLPMAAQCHLETLADGSCTGLVGLTDEAVSAITDRTRSLISGPGEHSLRMGPGSDIEFVVDDRDPTGVIRVSGREDKDSAPINGYAPAEGITGRYAWFPEHRAKVAERGHLFAKIRKKRGSGGAISQALGLEPGAAAAPDEVKSHFKELLQMEPLAYTEQEIKDIRLDGHTFHVYKPEWARTIGEKPALPFLSGELAQGFSEPDVRALGHWMRDERAKNEAMAERAAVEAAPEQARVAAARAAVPGQAATRGQMHIYYGDAGAGVNRISERVIQLRVRQRLTHVVRAVLQHHGGWLAVHASHRGQDDLFLLAGTNQEDGAL